MALTTRAKDIYRDELVKLKLTDVMAACGDSEPEGTRFTHAIHAGSTDKNAAYYSDENKWWCYNCAGAGETIKGGGVIEYVIASQFGGNTSSYNAAVDWLCDTFNIQRGTSFSYCDRHIEVYSQLASEIHNWIENLQSSKHVLDWLESRYGISKDECAHYGIGLYNGYKCEDKLELINMGLLSQTSVEQFTHSRIMIPFYRGGQPVYYTGRIFSDSSDDIKYKNPPQTNYLAKTVLGYDAAINAPNAPMLICEGVMDYFAALRCGILAVSTAGTNYSAVLPDLVTVCRTRSSVTICYDSDANKVGWRAAENLAMALGDEGIPAQILKLPLPGGRKKLDLSDYVLENGTESTATLISTGFTGTLESATGPSCVDYLAGWYIRELGDGLTTPPSDAEAKRFLKSLVGIGIGRADHYKTAYCKLTQLAAKSLSKIERSKAQQGKQLELHIEQNPERTSVLLQDFVIDLETQEYVSYVTKPIEVRVDYESDDGDSSRIERSWITLKVSQPILPKGQPLSPVTMTYTLKHMSEVMDTDAVMDYPNHDVLNNATSVCLNSWSFKNIAEYGLPAFMRDPNLEPDFMTHFNRLLMYFDKYIVFKEPTDKLICALYCVMTFVFQLFPTGIPYIALNGDRGSGKSSVLDIMQLASFNSMIDLATTPAVMFRNTHSCSPTWILHENDKLAKPGAHEQESTVLDILKGGYTKGAVVTRTTDPKKGTQKAFKIFCPKVFASTKQLDRILHSRCIGIDMLSIEKLAALGVEMPGNRSAFGIKELMDTDPWPIQNIKDAFQCWALTQWPVLQRLKEDMYEEFADSTEGRGIQIALPILVLARHVDNLGGTNYMPAIRKSMVEKRKISEVISGTNHYNDYFVRLMYEIIEDELQHHPWGSGTSDTIRARNEHCDEFIVSLPTMRMKLEARMVLDGNRFTNVDVTSNMVLKLFRDQPVGAADAVLNGTNGRSNKFCGKGVRTIIVSKEKFYTYVRMRGFDTDATENLAELVDDAEPQLGCHSNVRD